MDTTGSAASPSRLRRLAWRVVGAFVWLLAIVQAAAMVDAGSSKFQSFAGWSGWFVKFGYPWWFSPVVGALEIVCGLLLLVPALSAYAAAILLVIMAGALHAVTTHTTDLSAFDPILGGVMLAPILAARWSRRWRPARRGIAELPSDQEPAAS